MPFALCFILFWLPIPNFFLKVVLCYTLLSNHYFLLFRCLQLVYFFCYRISSWFLASHYFLLLRFLVSCYPMAILYLIYASFFGYLWSLFHIIHVMGIQLIAFVCFHQLKKNEIHFEGISTMLLGICVWAVRIPWKDHETHHGQWIFPFPKGAHGPLKFWSYWKVHSAPWKSTSLFMP